MASKKMTKQEKLELLISKFEELDEKTFELWVDEQPDEDGYGTLFYELMFPKQPLPNS